MSRSPAAIVISFGCFLDGRVTLQLPVDAGLGECFHVRLEAAGSDLVEYVVDLLNRISMAIDRETGMPTLGIPCLDPPGLRFTPITSWRLDKPLAGLNRGCNGLAICTINPAFPRVDVIGNISTTRILQLDHFH